MTRLTLILLLLLALAVPCQAQSVFGNPTLQGNNTWTGTNIFSGTTTISGTFTPTTITFPSTSGTIQTGTTSGDTLLLKVYDNDTGPAYKTAMTATAGNSPTVAWSYLTYLNFDATAGASGYGLRVNSGNMEFKNSGGDWTAIPSAVASQAWTRSGTNLAPSNAGDSVTADSGLTVGESTTYDGILITPVVKGAGQANGTITSADLTAARTWTLPNITGTFAFTGASQAVTFDTVLSRSIVTSVTTTAAPTEAQSGTVYVTGDADGSAVTLPNDPSVTGLSYRVIVDTTQTSNTFTLSPSAGESLYYAGSTYATSCTSVQIGSSITVLNTTTGSGAKWVIVALTGTWSCS